MTTRSSPPSIHPSPAGTHHQSCLDATFGMVYEQLRQKAFCRGTAVVRQRRQQQQQSSPTAAGAPPAAAAGASDGAGGAGGGRAAGPPWESSGRSAGPAAVAGDVGGEAAAVGWMGGEGGTVFAAAPAVAEREESPQVSVFRGTAPSWLALPGCFCASSFGF